MKRYAIKFVLLFKKIFAAVSFLLSLLIIGIFVKAKKSKYEMGPICKYFIYNSLSFNETLYANYTISQITPGICPSTGRICWIKICDQDGDGDVDELDFNTVVLGAVPGAGLDSDRDGFISDDQTENHSTIEECFSY